MRRITRKRTEPRPPAAVVPPRSRTARPRARRPERARASAPEQLRTSRGSSASTVRESGWVALLFAFRKIQRLEDERRKITVEERAWGSAVKDQRTVIGRGKCDVGPSKRLADSTRRLIRGAVPVYAMGIEIDESVNGQIVDGRKGRGTEARQGGRWRSP